MSVMSSACVWILCRIVFACVVGVRVATEIMKGIVREAGESEIDGMGGRPRLRYRTIQSLSPGGCGR